MKKSILVLSAVLISVSLTYAQADAKQTKTAEEQKVQPVKRESVKPMQAQEHATEIKVAPMQTTAAHPQQAVQGTQAQPVKGEAVKATHVKVHPVSNSETKPMKEAVPEKK